MQKLNEQMTLEVTEVGRLDSIVDSINPLSLIRSVLSPDLSLSRAILLSSLLYSLPVAQNTLRLLPFHNL